MITSRVTLVNECRVIYNFRSFLLFLRLFMWLRKR